MYGVSEETYLHCYDTVMNALISKIECIIKFLTETNSRILLMCLMLLESNSPM